MAYNTFFPPVQGQFIFGDVNRSNHELSHVIEQTYIKATAMKILSR